MWTEHWLWQWVLQLSRAPSHFHHSRLHLAQAKNGRPEAVPRRQRGHWQPTNTKVNPLTTCFLDFYILVLMWRKRCTAWRPPALTSQQHKNLWQETHLFTLLLDWFLLCSLVFRLLPLFPQFFSSREHFKLPIACPADGSIWTLLRALKWHTPIYAYSYISIYPYIIYL